MEQHHTLKDLQMVNQISGPIVVLELGEPETRQDQFLHDLMRERRIDADIITMREGSMTEFLDPLVHFLKFLIEGLILIMGLKGFLTIDGECFFLERVMIGTEALCFLLSLFGGHRPTCPSRSSLD